jgi:hypothetical protein
MAVLAPPLHRWLSAGAWSLIMRLRPGSRLRQAVLERSCLRTFNAFNRRDMRVFLSSFDPNVVYDVTHVEGWPDEKVYFGHTGLLEMARSWHETWRSWFDLLEVRDLGGGTCLVVGEFKMTGAGSGVPLSHVHWSQVATARRGLGVRIDNYSDRQEALDAAAARAAQ